MESKKKKKVTISVVSSADVENGLEDAGRGKGKLG